MPPLLLHTRSRSPHRREAVPAAAAAIALAGCTSAAPSTPGPSTVAGAVEITGAGSTFDAPFFTAAFAAYQQAHLGVAVSYAAVGSSAGITAPRRRLRDHSHPHRDTRAELPAGIPGRRAGRGKDHPVPNPGSARRRCP
jgi:hypothetical protein